MLGVARKLYIRAAIGLVEASSRAAGWVLTGTGLLTAALLYYTVTHLSLDTSTENMLDPNLPFRKLEREFDQAFPQFSDLIVVVIEADSAARAEDAADRLAAEFHRHPTLIQSTYRPGAGPFFERNGLLYLDTEALWTLDERFAEAEPFLGTMAHDPSLRGLFSMLSRAFEEKLSVENEKVLKKVLDRLSEVIEAQLAGRSQQVSWRDAWLEDTKAASTTDRSFIVIQPRLDYTKLQPGKEALELIRQLTRQPELQQQGIRARITGSVAMEDEELATVSQDSKITTGLSFGLVCLLLLLGLRSPRPVLAILTTLGVGLIWVAAFSTFAIGSLNLISISFAVLFIGMGVDFGIQFGMRYQEELEAKTRDPRVVLHDTAAGVGGALILAAVAASISFFSFTPTSYKGLAELGIISGVGMFVALFANLTVLPALLTVMPVRTLWSVRRRAGLVRLSLLISCYRRPILGVMVLVIVGASVLLPRARFDFDPLNLRDPTTEAVATFRDLLRDPDTTPYTIDVLADNLEAAKVLAARLEKLQVVDKTVTLTSYLPTNQDEKLAIIEDMNTVLQPLVISTEPLAKPSLDQQIAALEKFQARLAKAQDTATDPGFRLSITRLTQALGHLKTGLGWPDQTLEELEPRVVGDFPKLLYRLQQLLKAERVTLANLPEDLKERYIAPDGRVRIEVFPKENLSDNRALRRFVKAVRAVAPTAIGTPVALLEGSNAVITACLQATDLALVATAVLLLVILRSVSTAFLAFLPLVLALDLTVASSVVFNLPFNLANIIALPLLIGLSNAYGIYLVLRRQSEADVDHLLRSSTPSAILFGGLTTVASFGTLVISRHPGLSHMGTLISLALSHALLCSLVVLPAIMAEIEARRARLTQHPVRTLAQQLSIYAQRHITRRN